MSKPSVLVYLTAVLFATSGVYYGYTHPALQQTNPISEGSAEALNLSQADRLILGSLAESQDNLPMALSHYTELLAVGGTPEIAEHATDLALTLEEMELAMSLAERWADLAPRDLQAQLVAMTLYLGKDRQKSKQYLQQAIQADPLELGLQLALIQSQLEPVGRTELYQTLSDLHQSGNTSAHLLYALAQTAIYEKDFTAGQGYLEKSLAQQPDFTPAIELKAKLIRQASPNDLSALAYLEQQKKQFSQDQRLQRFYIEALVDGRHFSKAIVELNNMLKQNPDSGQILLLLGEVHELAGQSVKATQYLEKATQKIPKPFAVHYLLGLIYHKQAEWPLALTHFAQVTEGRFYVPAILSRALILNEQAQFEESLALLRQADPTDFAEQKQLLLLELDTLIQAKHIPEAKALLQDVLDNLPHDPDFLQKSEEFNKLP